MRSIVLLGVGFLMVGVLGCSSAETRIQDAEARRAEAKASMAEEQLKLMQDYRDCLKKAKGEQAAAECQRFAAPSSRGVATKGASQ